MRRLLGGVLIASVCLAGVGAAYGQAVVLESDAREMVEVKTKHALKLAEGCFQKAYLMLSIYEMKQEGVSKAEVVRRVRSVGITEEEVSDLLIEKGYELASSSDKELVQEYNACIEGLRPNLGLE